MAQRWACMVPTNKTERAVPSGCPSVGDFPPRPQGHLQWHPGVSCPRRQGVRSRGPQGTSAGWCQKQPPAGLGSDGRGSGGLRRHVGGGGKAADQRAGRVLCFSGDVAGNFNQEKGCLGFPCWPRGVFASELRRNDTGPCSVLLSRSGRTWHAPFLSLFSEMKPCRADFGFSIDGSREMGQD